MTLIFGKFLVVVKVHIRTVWKHAHL